MTSINISDYVLVKDKDGQLKYYKDGQFYSVEEIEGLIKSEESKEEKKKEPVVLKPVLTLEKKAPVKPKKTLKPLKMDMSVEEVKPNEDLTKKRTQDQKLIDEKVQHIIDKLKIQFSDDKIKQRFVNILTTYFRGIRKVKQIEYILSLPKIDGGMELSKDKIDLIVSVLTHHVEDLHKKRKDVAASPGDRVATLDHRLEPPPPSLSPQSVLVKPIKSVKKVTSIKPVPVKKVKPKTMVKPLISKPKANAPVQTAKPRVQDVKPANRQLTGPLEELQYMTLEDFRRLGRDQKEIVSEVIERVMLLKEESLVKQVQGIKAWKSSPVFKMYLSLSLRGIQDKKTIEQLIEDDQTNNRDTLTISEYEAIGQLNQKLSY